MEMDLQKCQHCGKPFQSPTDAEAVCECSKSTLQQPKQPEGGIVYLLPCPKCGDQKHAKASMIGKAENCQCGYEFRYTLVLSPIRPEPVGWMQTIQHHSTVCTQKTLHWWRQSAVPWMKRTGTYIREHVIPRTIAISKSAWKWLVDSVGSWMTAPTDTRSEERDSSDDLPKRQMASPRPAIPPTTLQITTTPATSWNEEAVAGLAKCKTCGKEVSKTAAACPHCGENAPGLHIACPKCGSMNVQPEQKGFGVGKAVAGGILLGPIGLLGGMHGRKKSQLLCRVCGHTW